MFKLMSIVGAVLLICGWMAVGNPNADESVLAQEVRSEWIFRLADIEDVRQSETGASVLGVMLDVSAQGEVELVRIMRASGTPRTCRTPRIDGQLYRWELRDALGVPLAEGEHFDRREQFTVSEEGACEQLPIGRHAMLIRVPGDTAAQTVALIEVDQK